MNRDSPFMAVYGNLSDETINIVTLLIDRFVSSGVKFDYIIINKNGVIIHLLLPTLEETTRPSDFDSGLTRMSVWVNEARGNITIQCHIQTHRWTKHIDEDIDVTTANFDDVVFHRCRWLVNNLSKEYCEKAYKEIGR